MDVTETGSATRRLALPLFGLLLVVYLITYSGAFLSTDERALFAAASSLAVRGTPTASQLFWEVNGAVLLNDDGEICANFEPAQAVLAAPLIWLARWLPRAGMVHAAFLFNVVVTAATAAVLFLFVCDLGYRRSTALVTAGLMALATMAWPYSKTFFREPLAALALLAGAWFLLRLGRAGRPLDASLAGLALGLSLTTKQVNVLALLALAPFGLSYLLQASPSWRARLGLAALIALAALAAFVPSYLYQQSCGRPSLDVTGAAIAGSLPRTSGFWGALNGFLFSPGRSVFLYVPLVLAAFAALPLAWRRHRREALLTACIFLVYLVGYAALKPHFWWGGLNWGPRFLVPVLPFLCLALAPAVAWVRDHPWALGRLLFGLLVVVSVAVQVVGISVPGLAYIEAVRSYGWDDQWERALYDPAFSQPLYSLRLLRPETLDFAWIHADGGVVRPDWLFLAAAAAALALAAVALRIALRRPLRRWLRACLWLAGPCLALLLLVRRYEDPRFLGGAEGHAMLEGLRQQARAGDVLVVTAGTVYGDFLLNYNKLPLEWYTLSLQQRQSQAVVAGLFERLAGRHERLWLLTDRAASFGPAELADAWLVAHLYPLQETEYSPSCRLMLFSARDLPDPDRPAVSLDLTLGDDIRLAGYDLPKRVLQTGDALSLSLLWEARQRPARDLTVFVQLLDAGGRLVLQRDGYPVRGQRPTSSWQPGERIRDAYGWVLPADLPAGTYRLIAGLYQLETMARLPVSDPTGRLLGDWVDLGTVEVR